MKVSFLSFDQDQNKIAYQSEVEFKNNTYYFKDKSIQDTMISLVIEKNFVSLKRVGYCHMLMKFQQDELTNGFYQNKDGITFNFTLHTSKLSIEKNKIRISYSLFLEGQEISSQRIQLLFLN